MQGIQASIELNDRFTDVIYGIINSVNLAVASVYDMQAAMGAGMDTGGIDAARDAAVDAAAAFDGLQAAMEIDGGAGEGIAAAAQEQENFNRKVQKGAQLSSELADKVKSAVMAYATIQSVGKALELSDELAQTTARLGMMNDGAQDTQELVGMVYAAAQDARGSFSEMADVVARFGNNAGDAFDSSAEVVAFAALIQKQMTIAGASTQEASNAMLQLSQALGSGVLRGDELNSIFEQAPNLIQSIADYLHAPIGQIREMAAAGELTADVVKAAIFKSADAAGGINEKFAAMPMTWGQAWQQMQNAALMAFSPVLQRIGDIAGSAAFQTFANNAIGAMAALAYVLLYAFDMALAMGTFVSDHWATIGPLVYGVVAALAAYAVYLGIVKALELGSIAVKGAMAAAGFIQVAALAAQTGATVAATAAQLGLNGAMYACPILWIVMLVIALVAIIIALCGWIAEATGAASSGIGIVVGLLASAGAFIGNIFIALGNLIGGLVATLWNLIAAFANFFANVFNDPVGSIARLFFDLVDCILSLLQTVAGAIDTLFGSNLSDAVGGWRDDLGAWVDEEFGQGEEIMAKAGVEDWKFDGRFEYGEAWDAGVELGDGIADSISNFSLPDGFGQMEMPGADPGGYMSNIDEAAYNAGGSLESIAGDTGAIKDSVEVSEEDLKYLRDIAEQEAVNRYTVAEITIDQSGMQNNISGGDDIDGFMSKLTDSVNEAVDSMTEGVHK